VPLISAAKFWQYSIRFAYCWLKVFYTQLLADPHETLSLQQGQALQWGSFFLICFNTQAHQFKEVTFWRN